MTKAVEIKIITNPQFNVARFALSIAAQIGVIGVGVYTQSEAMQWCGFLVLVLLVLGLIARDNKGLTFDEARAKIDELEAKSNRRPAA